MFQLGSVLTVYWSPPNNSTAPPGLSVGCETARAWLCEPVCTMCMQVCDLIKVWDELGKVWFSIGRVKNCLVFLSLFWCRLLSSLKLGHGAGYLQITNRTHLFFNWIRSWTEDLNTTTSSLWNDSQPPAFHGYNDYTATWPGSNNSIRKRHLVFFLCLSNNSSCSHLLPSRVLATDNIRSEQNVFRATKCTA